MKLALKIIGMVLLALVLSVAGFYFYSRATDFKPAKMEVLYQSESPVENTPDSIISLTTWNLGYFGLGAKATFFFDGGEQMRCSEAEQIENMQAVLPLLQKFSSNFYLLQELDMYSHRSYQHNQVDSVRAALLGYDSHFAPNYHVKFIPQPLSDPMGRVYSGILSLSTWHASRVERWGFVADTSSPTEMFMPDYCFVALYYPLSTHDTLVVVNTHSSAFTNNELKTQQTEQIRNFMQNTYAKGHYVIVGGDWNQYPSPYEPLFTNKATRTFVTQAVDNPFIDGWKVAYDAHYPTNREVNKPFNEDSTYMSILDFFVVSPNIEVQTVQTENLQFAHTDHQPVTLRVKLIEKNHNTETH